MDTATRGSAFHRSSPDPGFALTVLAPWLRGLCMVVAFTAMSSVARAQTPDPGTWIPDGPVHAIACDPHTVYLGGRFQILAPPTGSGAVVGLSTHARPRPTATVEGAVFAVVPDEAGGWFIGGRFTHVGGAPHAYLAHVLADGQVADWNPAPDGFVRELVLRGTTLYLCGDFTHVAGVPRNGVAAVDVVTGALAPFHPRIEAGIPYTIALDGATLYIGGLFEFVHDARRSNLAAVDAITGDVLPWAPHPAAPVRGIAPSSEVVYVTGESVGLVAYDARTGTLLPWAPAVSGAFRIVLDHRTLYAYGPHGVAAAGNARPVVAVDAGTGQVLPWDPQVSGGAVNALAVHGNQVLLGGSFTEVGGVFRGRVAAVDARTGSVLSWSPLATDAVHALSVAYGSVYVGGAFQGFGGVRRRYVAALDASTGVPTDWNPMPTRPAHPNSLVRGHVDALAVRGARLYVGGDFDSIASQPRGFLAAFDIGTGELLPWSPDVSRGVTAVGPTDSVVYFASGAARAARVADGAMTAFVPEATRNGPRFDLPGIVEGLAVEDGRIYIGGNFDKVNGDPHWMLAALDPGTGAPFPWMPQMGSFVVYALLARPGIVFAGGYSDCAAFDAATAATRWSVPGETTALFEQAGTLYRAEPWLGRVSSLDVATGEPRSWTASLPGLIVALASDGAHLYAGGSINPFIGVFARFTLADGMRTPGRLQPTGMRPPAAPLLTGPSLVRGQGAVRFALSQPALVSLGVFDLQGRRMGTLLDDAWLGAGVHEVPVAASRWSPGVYLCRFEVDGRVITRRMVVVR